MSFDASRTTTSAGGGVRVLIERRSIQWVPPTERHGKVWHQFPLWFSGNFQYFSIPIGFIGPMMGLSFGWSAVTAVAGTFVGTLFMAFHASQGPQMGLPQMIQSRAQFGYRGVIVPLGATFFTYVAFNVADQILLGEGLRDTFGWNAAVVSACVVSGVTVLAVFGHDWLHLAFRLLLVLSVPLVTVLTIGIVLGSAGGHPGSVGGFAWSAFVAQFSAAAAYNITYAPYVSDYSRYLPVSTRASHVIASVFFGAAASAIWLIILGAWMSTRLGATDGLAGLQMAGNNVLGHLGDVTAVVSALALAATMGMNSYGGALTALTAVDSFAPIEPSRRFRVVTTIGVSLLGYVIASLISGGAAQTVMVSLTLMLYLLVPWTAVNLVDYFLVRRGHYEIPELFNPYGIYHLWAWQGLTAYAIGLAAETPFMVLPNLGPIHYTGPWAVDGTDVAWIVGLAVTALAYWMLAGSINATTAKGDSQVAVCQ